MKREIKNKNRQSSQCPMSARAQILQMIPVKTFIVVVGALIDSRSYTYAYNIRTHTHTHIHIHTITYSRKMTREVHPKHA